MARAEKNVTINAPAEKIFNYLANPANLPEIWPGMVEVKNLKTVPGGGYDYEWVYKMAGMRFEGASETTEYVPHQRLVDKSKKGIESVFTWTFTPEGEKTHLKLDVEYKVPLPLLGKLAENLVLRQNEREADTFLGNLKALMES